MHLCKENKVLQRLERRMTDSYINPIIPAKELLELIIEFVVVADWFLLLSNKEMKAEKVYHLQKCHQI